MVSLTDLSNKLNISKPALMARIRKISGFRAKYCKLKDHKLFISINGAKLISYDKHDSTSKAFHTRKGSSHFVTKSELISDNHKLIGSNYLLIQKIHSLKNSNRLLRSKCKDANKRLMRLPNVRHMTFLDRLKMLFGYKRD